MATTKELLAACSLLFGKSTIVSPAFLKILKPSGIKSAYRRRVMETHPDRAQYLGTDPERLNEEFRRLNRAYLCLRHMVQHRSAAGGRTPQHRPPCHRSASVGPQARYHEGPLPARPLPLGQFLYYSGVISWQSLVQALIWQRSSRPRLGKIARQWGMLSEHHVTRLLASGPAGEKFGERALRYGYLTSFQLLALLGHQKKHQLPIGRYFLLQRLLTASALARYLAAQRMHNHRFRSF